MTTILLVSVIIIATCGLVYELIAGTAASYLLGDSVTQFSTIIGCYLFSMGIGSWLTRYINRNLLAAFIRVEILVGVIGGCSAVLLFVLFEYIDSFRILLYLLVSVIGILVGIEIPLLLRMLKDRFEFRDLVSRVLALDYVGALFASLLFPLLLVPYLGLVKSSFMFGVLNVSVAVWVLYAIRDDFPWVRLHRWSAVSAMVGLIFGFVYSEKLMSFAETSAYDGTIIYSRSSPYQRIVITKEAQDLRLYLNANLQFSSIDEYRYHEALVHPALAALPQLRQVLVLGGGDGLAIREILKYPTVESITVVDLDPLMTDLFSSSPLLTSLNQSALLSPKVTIINRDAFVWLREQARLPQRRLYDAVLMDVPDPSNFSIGKLYTTTFFELLHHVTHDQSMITVQSTSPLFARKSFWCINKTIQASGFMTTPYHTYVPSFGEWGFIIASRNRFQAARQYPDGLRYISVATVRQIFHFPADMAEVDTRVQRLDDQILVHYFDDEWSDYLIY